MRTFLLALVIALVTIGISRSSHATCPTPNPNNNAFLNGQTAVDQCDLPAGTLNRLANVPFASVLNWGAAGDGVTDDTTAFQNAINFVNGKGGGVVWVPATGHAYVIAGQVTVPAGVHIQGVGHFNWNTTGMFFDYVEADWTKYNTWIHCTSTTVGSCFDVTGQGVSMEHLNFWYTQPTPAQSSQCSTPCTFTSYTPTSFPWTIQLNGQGTNFAILNDVNILNGYNCIDWEAPSTGIGGISSYMTDEFLGCMGTGTKFHYIDNTMHFSNLHYEVLFGQGTSDWWNAMENNGAIGWDVQYMANPIIDAVEFSFLKTAMKFTDATVSSGFGNITLAMTNAHAHGLSFNEVCQGMVANGATTHLTGSIEGLTVAQDTTTSQVSGQCANSATPSASTLLYLPSSNVNLMISGLYSGQVQQLAYLGGSGGSQLHLDGINLQLYSAFLNGGVALTVDSSGSLIDFMGNVYIYPSGTFTAGALCSGSGCFSAPQTRFGEEEVTTPSGTNAQTCYTNLATPPGTPGVVFQGTQVFCIRKDTSGNFNIDRYVGGSYDESPIQIPGTTLASVKFPEAIAQSKGFTDVPVLISALPSCASGQAGTHRTISNGISSPTYGATVSSTGTITEPVFCNGANWVYQ